MRPVRGATCGLCCAGGLSCRVLRLQLYVPIRAPRRVRPPLREIDRPPRLWAGSGRCSLRIPSTALSKLRGPASVFNECRRASHRNMRLLWEPVHTSSAARRRRTEGRGSLPFSRQIPTIAKFQWLGAGWRKKGVSAALLGQGNLEPKAVRSAGEGRRRVAENLPPPSRRRVKGP